MNSKPFSLGIRDFAKGAFLVVVVAFLGGIQQTLMSPAGFHISEWDWGMITNTAIMAFTAYMGKQFVSDSNGTPFGSAK